VTAVLMARDRMPLQTGVHGFGGVGSELGELT
jgi:hypothetical protein